MGACFRCLLQCVMPQAELHSSDLPASCTPPSQTRPPAEIQESFWPSSTPPSARHLRPRLVRSAAHESLTFCLPSRSPCTAQAQAPGSSPTSLCGLLTGLSTSTLTPLRPPLPTASRSIFPLVNPVVSCHATALPWFPVTATLMPTLVMPLCTSPFPSRGLARPENASVEWKKGRGMFQVLTPDSGFES